MSKIDHSLFRANEHALEEAFGLCPKCQGALHIKHGKSGKFIGCTHFPTCDYTKALHETETTELKRIDGSHCPECNEQLAIKKGRYGLFIGCSNFPHCHHIESVKKEDDTKLTCPQCNQGHLLKRTNKFGKNFYACSTYPACKYLLNHEPIEQPCPECHWPIAMVKQGAQNKEYICPQKTCQHKWS